jgi:FkbM family methyltransferase
LEPLGGGGAGQPSMEFEHRTEELLRRLLPTVDPGRIGACIEIGVGTYHWYCDLFARAGYRSVAIEPVPAEPFIHRLGEGDIVFHEGVVSDRDGYAHVYLGKNGDTNLSSIRPDWWAATEATKSVVSMTLATIMRKSSIDRLTCLKVDAEGSEARILKQLLDFPRHLLPSLVVFEFGAAVWSDGKWLDHFDADTMECLRILRSCGYGHMTTIDVFSEERAGDLQRDVNPETYFGKNSQAGNAIAQVGAGGK